MLLFLLLLPRSKLVGSSMERFAVIHIVCNADYGVYVNVSRGIDQHLTMIKLVVMCCELFEPAQNVDNIRA